MAELEVRSTAVLWKVRYNVLIIACLEGSNPSLSATPIKSKVYLASRATLAPVISDR
jgi:hypothetical protein